MLVVQENLLCCVAIAQLIEQMNLTCDMAHSSWDAVEKVKKSLKLGITYKLIFIDLELPGSSGLQASQLIKEHID